MAAPRPRRQALAAAEEIEYDRVLFFSDAVFAAVIGLFWLAHHSLFRHIKGLNRPLMLLNLLFLGCVASLPYPTSLLSAAADQAPATVFYALSIAAAGLAEAAIWLYAIHVRELALPGVPPVVYRWILEPPEVDSTITEGDDDPHG
jgi:Endosomal/lysosomal potassium channel TMEM175